ncbi:MAG: TldD/PmbA family protein, partial [Bdellovibrionaceae bacterium]|nr:TldD/PmbA family protein [Pseudobdellovibrionaceae bacterium]
IKHVLREEYYLNSSGAQIEQQFSLWNYDAKAIAQEGGQTQKRSFHGGSALCRQGHTDVIDAHWWREQAKRISIEAAELLRAPPCPSGVLDLLLDPDQMLLQIHESIGHPLELDRILGDERNYAGWSFVTLKDFGSLQFGSPFLNVTFNPDPLDGFASYAFDQSGLPAQKTYLIKDGILLRPLGGLESSIRSGLPAVANFRASSWNRAPIDRMANIDIEPGRHSLEDMISNIEMGVYMKSNSSWSIDDYRRKFQFSCEWAQVIRNGKLAEVVKNPGYRGEGLSFWRSLAMVGNESTFARYGSPYCGKGEPSQIIRVSHGSPACLFRSVEVFGYD